MKPPGLAPIMLAIIMVMPVAARAQADLQVYTDTLINNFQDWSWAPDNISNTSPVHSGTDSISVSGTDWTALSIYHTPFSTGPYTNLTFWINGGAGGQVLTVQGWLNEVLQTNYYYLIPALPANTWQQITIPLSTLGVANKPDYDRFAVQITDSGTTNTFYVDDIQFTANSSMTRISVNAAHTVRTAGARWFGINAATWDADLDTPETVLLLKEIGFQLLRFPGGSEADEYQWNSNTAGGQSAGASTFDNFAHVATNIGAQAIITVNYGSGSAAEAAAWVNYSNQTNHYHFKYWEIGNECYGTWETDTNANAHDAYTYAVHAQAYIQQMKAADPTVKVGVVVIPGETQYSNGYTGHPAYNPRTGQTNYGWTAVLFTTLKSLGVTPDFAIHHHYPEYDDDNDQTLLAGTSGWVGDASDLRQQITDYFGTGGTNIELLCTENNSDAGNQGKQSVSLVNGIYYADSFAQLMQTEFNSYLWWDLRNGLDTSGDMDPSLYGWRPYGDFGFVNGLGTALADRYPQFFTAKLMQYFVRPGDAVLSASSDNALLSAYSVRRTNGALTLLVINKDPATTYTAQVALSGFTPGATATVYSYGMPQDNAAETGVGSPDIAQSSFAGAGVNFNYTFAPYSATVFSLGPSAPVLAALKPQPSSGKFVLRLNGQAGARYVLQASSNLKSWTPVSTNALSAASLNITNAMSAGTAAQFWRALWQP